MKVYFLLFPLAAVLAGGTASAGVLWRGDFETNDLSQWSRADSVDAASRLKVVPDPVAEGTRALHVTVKPGDYSSSGYRNELEAVNRLTVQGTERWYRWYTMWPNDYQSPDAWQIFTQWHHVGCCGSPPLVLSVKGEDLRLVTPNDATTHRVFGKLERGRWHEFVVNVKWSPSSGEGFVSLWQNGKNVVPRFGVATMFPGEANYLKQGLYRDPSINLTQQLFHDGFVEGETQQDVMGGAPPPPPPPAPTTTPPPEDTIPPAPAPSPVHPEDAVALPAELLEPGVPGDPTSTSAPTEAGTLTPGASDGAMTSSRGCAAAPGAVALGFAAAGLLPLLRLRRRRRLR